MMPAPARAIDVVNVTKTYRRYARRKQFATLKSAILSGTLVGDLRPEDSFHALRGVSFGVRAGSTFGIVGRNGSGKSTALKLVAGITKPTTGTVSVRGRISALIELGAGFHPEISGRENVFINGIMLGLTKREITRRFDEIVEFAELEDFIDAPVKTYSSGMYMRLGFAVAINVDPDVLLIDEVLAVGDEAFTHKCLDKFAEYRRRNKTVLLVTHALNLVERFCDEALWLDDGRARAVGDPRRVVSAYITDVEKQEERHMAEADAKAREAVERHDAAPAEPESRIPRPESPRAAPPDMFQAAEGRWGSREGEITDVRLVGEDGQPARVFYSGERVAIRLSLKAAAPLDDFVIGIGIFNADGVCAFGTNTNIEDLQGERLEGEGEAVVTIDALDLVAGTYKLDVALHKLDGYPYDYHRLLYSFRVKSRTRDAGIYRPRHSWGFSGGVRVRERVAGS
ncbi:MAG TPA: ABC transporter ATP-binding protein [Vicinamibacterales bacterium]|nr:ABC transporter ATP-binding protein [Vicinamibacterales bacterium]HPK70899.1 ABC transporter ATP-binding protein [Vicinamibacterales bacterium]